MKTIVQEYGPIYGEPVNGTVMGRPNGSIYVPPTNRITLNNPTEKIKNVVYLGAYRIVFCDDSGVQQWANITAESQDLSNVIRVVLATDAGLTTIVAALLVGSGNYNVGLISMIANYQLDPDDTYYMAAQLVSNGTPIATSNIVEVTVWSE